MTIFEHIRNHILENLPNNIPYSDTAIHFMINLRQIEKNAQCNFIRNYYLKKHPIKSVII